MEHPPTTFQMPGEVMFRSSPAMHMVARGLPAPGSTGGGAGAATDLYCRSPASAATIRWMASQR